MCVYETRFMCYFSIFGFVEKSWTMVAAFRVISLVAAVVESLPISTRLDDNLTVPVASVLPSWRPGFLFHWSQKPVLHEQPRQEKYFSNRWNGVCRQQQLKQVATVQEQS